MIEAFSRGNIKKCSKNGNISNIGLYYNKKLNKFKKLVKFAKRQEVSDEKAFKYDCFNAGFDSPFPHSCC